MNARTVVVGIDGSDEALDAVRWAAAEAVRRRAALRLVGAVDWPRGGHVGDIGINYQRVFVDTAREQVKAAGVVAREAVPGIDAEEQVVIGFPIPVLRSEARRAELVVLGSRGLGGVTGLLVGSVAVALASQAECPVVVVRGEGGDPHGPVVVGVDGSPLSEAALAYAFDTAAARGVGLVAVHAWSDGLLDPSLAALVDWSEMESDETALLAERLAGWSSRYPDVAVERVVRRDRPANALLEQAEKAQLVVVGSRGRGSVAGLILGSVSHALLHRSPCPVVIVRS